MRVTRQYLVVSTTALCTLLGCSGGELQEPDEQGQLGASSQAMANTARGNHGRNGDYDGDGLTDYAVFRPTENNWLIKTQKEEIKVVNWGLNTDILVPADFDGDRKTDFAIFRPSIVAWSYKVSLSPSSSTIVYHGVPTDVPTPGDYNGDGIDDM